MSWDERMNEMKMEETPMVFLSSLLGQMDIDKDTKIKIAENILIAGDYELDFLYSFTVHLADLLADIEKIGEGAEQPLEFNVSELLERTLQLMGVKDI